MKKIFLSFSILFYAIIGFSQNIGFGTATPTYPLTLPSVLGDKISLWGGDGAPNANHYGLGVQGSLLQLFTPGGGDIAFGTGRSAAFTENVRITGLGEIQSKGTFAGFTFFDRADLTSLPKRFVWYNNNNAARLYSGTLGDIMTIEHTGDVGIGTTNPTSKLHVNGALRIVDGTQANGKILSSDVNGNASWQNITRTDTLSLAPACFIDRNGSADINRLPGTFFIINQSGALYAPLPLPQGAEITKVTAWFRDNVADNLTIELAKLTFSTGTVSIIHQFTTSGASASFRSQSMSTPGYIINNLSAAYFINAYCPNWPGIESMQIVGVIVEYHHQVN